MGIKDTLQTIKMLDIDIYKIELWKLLRDILRLLDCDVQDLEDQIFPTIIGEDGDNCDTTYLILLTIAGLVRNMILIIMIGKQRILKEMNHWININHYLKEF